MPPLVARQQSLSRPPLPMMDNRSCITIEKGRKQSYVSTPGFSVGKDTSISTYQFGPGMGYGLGCQGSVSCEGPRRG